MDGWNFDGNFQISSIMKLYDSAIIVAQLSSKFWFLERCVASKDLIIFLFCHAVTCLDSIEEIFEKIGPKANIPSLFTIKNTLSVITLNCQ